MRHGPAVEGAPERREPAHCVPCRLGARVVSHARRRLGSCAHRRLAVFGSADEHRDQRCGVSLGAAWSEVHLGEGHQCCVPHAARRAALCHLEERRRVAAHVEDGGILRSGQQPAQQPEDGLCPLRVGSQRITVDLHRVAIFAPARTLRQRAQCRRQRSRQRRAATEDPSHTIDARLQDGADLPRGCEEGLVLAIGQRMRDHDVHLRDEVRAVACQQRARRARRGLGRIHRKRVAVAPTRLAEAVMHVSIVSCYCVICVGWGCTATCVRGGVEALCSVALVFRERLLLEVQGVDLEGWVHGDELRGWL